jgi:dipeptidyl aminopeptidase/acylaminoacyl peptidase
MARPALHRLTSIALLAALGALAAAGLMAVPPAASQDATPVPTPTEVGAPTSVAAPAPIGDANGAIDRQTLIYATDHSAYYAITYWSDGLRVAGFLGFPTGDGPYPAIIHNRGGYDGVGALTGIELVNYVEAGYVAAASQYRGNGGGEGREDFGGQDVDDVLALIPLLKALPFVDPDRIGLFGGSRGGMMTFIALKRQTLSGAHDIKVAVTVGGIADLFAWDRERGGSLAGVLWLPLVGATPAQDPQAFEDRSAVYWPELIDVPILLLHGEADTEVSIDETRHLAELLLAAGKQVETVTYPGGDHPLTAYHGGAPDALAWFGLYLGGDGVDRSFAAYEDAISAVATWFLANR